MKEVLAKQYWDVVRERVLTAETPIRLGVPKSIDDFTAFRRRVISALNAPDFKRASNGSRYSTTIDQENREVIITRIDKSHLAHPVIR